MNVNACLTYYWNEHVLEHVVDQERIANCCKPLQRHLGRKRPENLLPADFRRYVRTRSKKCGQGTIRRELSCLASALALCHRDRRIPAPPRIPLPAPPPAKDRFLSRDEAESLLNAAGERARLFIRIALATGGRPEAVDALTWPQVNLTARTIDFNAPGRRQTGKRRPVVPISDELHDKLVAAQARAKNQYVLGSPASTRKCFETARKNAGLIGVTRKTLRHTYATWAAQAGVSLWKIAGVLGDAVETVEKKYAHHHPDYLRDAVNF